ncbi:imidazole glycerol phosphate synthase subunit HisH [Candidatus Pelagibacter communis]|uniref:imidazole glycerol phosphate synthase subunit HisH n=1 Tax=Pelagibacter ubique TaxID=198252 RepID=UPI00065B4040|nr:imidazole glycerol phosphate synthase subunit HisH [Candidatus Pelagibacter ubique]
MIVIFDVKTGNITSIKKALDYLNINNKISDKEEDLKKSSKIILPGVGAFDNFMNKLEETNLKNSLIYEIKDKKKPFLGICLGMQLLLHSSEEGNSKGLGLIDGKIKKFDKNLNIRIPHMGLNYANVLKKNNLIKGEKKKFYFVHSYFAEVKEKNIIAVTRYGIDFPSIINENNLYGVQFHPEKSQNDGKDILENFSKL